MAKEDPMVLEQDKRQREKLEQTRMYWEDPLYEARRRRWEERTLMTLEDAPKNQQLAFRPASGLARELAAPF